MFRYTLIYSRRKSLAIHIKPDGEVEVRAPKRLSVEVIEKFIKSKEKWVEEKVIIAKEKSEERRGFSVTSGDKLIFLGKEYPVCFSENCSFDNERFTVVKGEFSEIKPYLVKLYKKLARNVILERVKLYSDKTELYPVSVRINSASTRWGSCSGKNSLNFSWRLIFAPLEVVDYVVVHELAHIKEHNHSVRFWMAVSEILPDYKAREKQLKLLHEKISRENWT